MKRHRCPVAVVLLLLAGACTGGNPGPSPRSSPTSGSIKPGAPPVVLDIVVTVDAGATDPARQQVERLEQGMKQAEAQVNAEGGVRGRPVRLVIRTASSADGATQLIGTLLDEGATAILYSGPGTALTPLQLKFSQAGTPVVLFGGDLYTGHQMFPQVFQVTTPWVWQVHVIARYLVKDRHAASVSVAQVAPKSQAKAFGDATAGAVAYWGGRFLGGVTGETAQQVQGGLGVIGDAVIVSGGAADSRALAAYVRTQRKARWVAGPEDLLVAGSGTSLAPGTVAPSTYTWSGWAEAIPRVKAYADAYRKAGGEPTDLSQQGYDAVRVLVRGLRTDGAHGGEALVKAMEGFRNVTFSGFPITFGPDDHVFAPRDELGLFVRPDPGERLDPWQRPGGETWRPLMRTFTYDGDRAFVLDQYKPVFFPFWHAMEPSPNYLRSRYGIVSPPSDPHH